LGQFFKVAKVVDLVSGKLRSVEAGGKRIALFSLGNEIFAIGDLGSHADHHAWHAATAGAPAKDVERYNVRLSGEDIEVEV
jgi:nitrite reductase/ring-hydroxylating ferredoxin subunit